MHPARAKRSEKRDQSVFLFPRESNRVLGCLSTDRIPFPWIMRPLEGLESRDVDNKQGLHLISSVALLSSVAQSNWLMFHERASFSLCHTKFPHVLVQMTLKPFITYHTILPVSKAFRIVRCLQTSRVISSFSCSVLHASYSTTHPSCFKSTPEGVLFSSAFRMLHARRFSH
jgi:hypothetical protein